MRHEKIKPADLVMSFPPSFDRIASPAAPAEEDRSAPVIQQHFFFCGRTPSPVSVKKSASAARR